MYNFPNSPTIGQIVNFPSSSQQYTWTGYAWEGAAMAQEFITGSSVSASYSVTASYALTASYISGAQANADTASYALTASYFLTSSVTSASYSETASYFLTSSVTSASYSATASYVDNAQTASYFLTSSVTSASYSETASFAITASYSIVNFVTSSVTSSVSASYSSTASLAYTANTALTASYSETASVARLAGTASLAVSALSSSYALTARSASFATTASYVQLAPGSQVLFSTTGSWTVTPGANNVSFTVDQGATYTMWVYANIPNGIITWNATATISNNNVPVVGAYYCWVYTGGGTPLDITSVPSNFVGASGSIVRNNGAGAILPTNTFRFSINNTSGANQTVFYGFTKL